MRAGRRRPALRMHIRILGAAAGGGFPQWNCNCPNCGGVRREELKARPRTQSSIAIRGADETAWTLVNAWHKHFEGRRPLHGTAHDVLMAAPGLGDYFRAVGVIAANRKSVTAALDKGEDVIVWPGGEVDAMRSWR